MTPIQIAMMCSITFSAPAEWDNIAMPKGAVVAVVDQKVLSAVCPDHARDYGCADMDKMIAYVPAYSAWHGTKFCYDELVRHEMAHLKGWRHPER